MKLIIFAGGTGKRLWPLSRVNSPKQFDRIFGGKSTLQLAFERVGPVFGPENIFIQTGESYKAKVTEQLPGMPENNIIIEPARRNVGPAVCLSVMEMKKRGYSGPIAILWADHLMERPHEFINALKSAEIIINEKPDRFVFLAEKPRFANNNLGWMKVGEKISGREHFLFGGWKYKPASEECRAMFESGDYFWNPGYFITSIDYLLELYRKLSPEIYGTVSSGRYEESPEEHFDRAIIEKLSCSQAVVIKTDMGWSDPGTLYALKEALEKDTEKNFCNGQVTSLNSKDCLFYNLENEKLMAGVGLNGIIAVNTPDALLIVSKDEVVNITNLIKNLEAEGKASYL